MPQPTLASLRLPFRDSYLTFADLTEQLRRWAKAFPEIAHLQSIGTSREGRELWLLTIGKDCERLRPGVWIDGNMHASELIGSSVALSIAEYALALHVDPSSVTSVSGRAATLARDALFYVMPRISPDGAEAVLQSGQYVRSVPRDDRPQRAHARWIAKDLNGDGAAFLMRKEDPTGEFVASTEHPHLLLPRELDDDGPFYKLYPEGVIENFDGSIPTPFFLADNDPDLNRNFPYRWLAEPDQVGAGRYPGSEPESRAVIEFATNASHLYAWLNLHSFGGVFIRPAGDKPDSKMNQNDLAYYKEIEHWSDELVGYPTVSGFEEFLYEPDKPLRGDLSEFAYEQRGCLAWACELWNFFTQVGLPRPKKFVDYYTHLTRDDFARIATWDRDTNYSRIFQPWKPFDHPQIGKVELGGIDPRVGLWNPPYELVPDLCDRMGLFMMRVAAMLPKLATSSSVESIDAVTKRVTLTVDNEGYLPTHGVDVSKSFPWNEPLTAEIALHGGAKLIAAHDARQSVGHLDGWGRGRFGPSHSLFFLRSSGNASRKQVSWIIQGRGMAKIRTGSCRTGWQETTVEIA